MPGLAVGTICLWSGSVGSIPAGWHQCNGDAGTPDLRNLFVLGAGGPIAPGDTGGTTEHNHDFTSDGHYHDITGGTDIASGTDRLARTNVITDSGTTQNKNHLPPYYALAYIMKI